MNTSLSPQRRNVVIHLFLQLLLFSQNGTQNWWFSNYCYLAHTLCLGLFDYIKELPHAHSQSQHQSHLLTAPLINYAKDLRFWSSETIYVILKSLQNNKKKFQDWDICLILNDDSLRLRSPQQPFLDCRFLHMLLCRLSHCTLSFRNKFFLPIFIFFVLF